MQLRGYQGRTIDELWAWFAQHREGNPIVNACVGAGKSLMIAALSQRANDEFPGTRILVLVHQKELLEQNLGKLNRIWPSAHLGVYSASFGRKQLGCQITFATIGSIYKDAHKLGRIDLVLADECHLISTREAGMWRKFLKDLSTYCPAVRVIGWTGTDFRGNGVFLTDGKEPLFTHVASRVTMRELLDLGYLVPLVPASTTARIDTADVRMSGDDFVVHELAQVTDKKELVEAACKEIVQLAKDRRRWLVFAVTVEHAEHVRDELVRLGIAAAMVSAETPKAERDATIRAFRAGTYRCLVNVAVLTTGFDVQEVDFIALLRATRSPVLYVQIAGRGMRCLGADINESIANGKSNCLWADFTDTTERMGPVDLIRGRPATNGARSGEQPMKICPECANPNPTAVMICAYCGFKFPEPDRVRHRQSASGAAVLSDQDIVLETVPVERVRYASHYKQDQPDSLRVEYMRGPLVIAKEWVCFSHRGLARHRAEQWWQERATIEQIPLSTKDALEWLDYDSNILRTPIAIIINANEKYPVVTGYRWSEDGEPQPESEVGYASLYTRSKPAEKFDDDIPF
jgi:DNA repair protein RadD